MTVKRRVLCIAAFDDFHAASAAHRVRALERLGAEVATFDLNSRPGMLKRFRAGDLPTRIERQLDEFQPHVVLTMYASVLNEDLIDRLRGRSSARWAAWLPDDLRTVSQATALARPYDDIYAVGTDVAAEIGESLGRTVEVLPDAADPSVYRPIRTRDQYRANVVFVGTATSRRERLLLELVEFGLAVWGPGWRNSSLKDYCRGEIPGTEAFVNAYGGASVAVNIHHAAVEGEVPEATCNMRLFELAAMGLPQAVDDRGDLPRYFAPGREVAVYRDGRELRAVVRALLENQADAERLGQSARARLLRDHTWMHRMRAFLLDQPGRTTE